MPIITVEGPPIEVETKRQFVKELTDAMAGAYPKINRDHFVVLIRENKPENVGSGGELIVDMRK